MPLSPVARLRRLADLAAAGDPLGDDGRWLAGVLRAYLEGAPLGLTMEAAFGLDPGALGAPWWEREATARRDDLVRRMAARFSRHAMAPSRQAKEIAAAARQYEARAWPRDRHRDRCPAHHRGKLEELLFEAHRSGAKWPLGWRRILEVLEAKGELFAVGGLSDCKGSRATLPSTNRDEDHHGEDEDGRERVGLEPVRGIPRGAGKV